MENQLTIVVPIYNEVESIEQFTLEMDKYLEKTKPSTNEEEGFAVRTRLELATPCVTGRYSNQLNYQTVA